MTYFRGVIPGATAIVPSDITLPANSVLANPGTASAAGVGAPVGDPLAPGVFFNALGELVGTPPGTYYLTKAADGSGFTGTTIVGASQPYYQATRVPSAFSENTITGTLSAGTSVLANFITAPGDPGAAAFFAGNTEDYIYMSVGAGGSATITVAIFRIGPDGSAVAEVTGTSATFSNTLTAGIKVHPRKLAATVLTNGPYDRLLIRISATYVAGPASFAITMTMDGSTNRSTACSTIAGPGVPSLNWGEYNVLSLPGGIANARTGTDGVIVAGSATLNAASNPFIKANEGMPIWVDGAGVGGLSGAPFASTITTFVNTGQVICAGTADTTTAGIQTFLGAVVSVSGTAGNYLPGVDTIAVVGGTSTITAVANVVSTQINPPTDTTPAVAIVAAGSGGITGTWIFETTTQVGSPARIRVVVDSTGIATSVALVSGGLFLTNPGTSAEPLVNTASGLTGLTVSITSIGVRTISVNTAGSYTVVPTDPFATGAGSSSGATGCTLDGSWGGAGGYLFGTDMNAIISQAQTLAATTNAKGRAIVRVPAGSYVLNGAALSIMTTPILIVGDGPNQTIINVAPTYAGPHVFGWSGLFGASNVSPASGNVGSVNGAKNGWGVANLTIAGFRSSANRQHALVPYDRNDGMLISNVQVRYMNGSWLWTGALSATTSGFLRESLIENYYIRNCGDNGFPAMNLDSVGTQAGDNFLTFNNGNIVFPVGPGVAVTNHTTKRDGEKTIYFNGLRIERGSGTFYGDEFQIGSITDLAAVANIYGNDVHLVGAESGVSALAFYGLTESTRPHDIRINGLLINGPVLGTGVSINAGYNIYINADQIEGRTASISTGNHGPYRKVTTAVAGSTSSTVATVLSPSGTNVGSAAVMIVPGQVVVGQSGTLLTVSAVNNGRLLADTPGSYVTTNGFGAENVVSQSSGTPGGIGVYVMSLSQTIAPGTTLDFNYFDSLNVVSSATTISTLGALPGQGGSATWKNTPVSGDTIAFQSLVDGDLLIDGGGQEKNYTYSLGVGVAALISRPWLIFGSPDGAPSTAENIAFTGTPTFTIGSNITATGTNQAGAYLLTALTTIFDTVASGAGARLPGWAANSHYKVINRGANALLLYPASGGQIETLGTNTAASITSGGDADLWADTTNLWRAT